MIEYVVGYLLTGLFLMTVGVIRPGVSWDPAADFGRATLYIFGWPVIGVVCFMMVLSTAIASILRSVYKLVRDKLSSGDT